jgi:lycopene beta-cyclase
MLGSPKLAAKKILLVDKTLKSGNDKTWCFWDKGNIAGFWRDANIIHHEWNRLFIKNYGKPDILADTGDYRYKMIRSADFYRHCFSVIKQAKNVTVVYGDVSAIDAEAGIITCDAIEYRAGQIFSSVLIDEPQMQEDDIYLLQHFKGWVIETKVDFFDPLSADLMNFKTPQNNGCTFLYLLPVSKTKALVEYTLFTDDLLQDDEYDTGLKDFISQQLGLKEFSISEVEKGIIPMTNMRFPPARGKIFFIGTAGGQTKASTGYTFAFIQKQAEQIVAMLHETGFATVVKQSNRFRFYDTVLLKILQERKLPGADVFYDMFKKNKAYKVFRFLDNETSLREEFQIMITTRWRVFTGAALKSLKYLR